MTERKIDIRELGPGEFSDVKQPDRETGIRKLRSPQTNDQTNDIDLSDSLLRTGVPDLILDQVASGKNRRKT